MTTTATTTAATATADATTGLTDAAPLTGLTDAAPLTGTPVRRVTVVTTTAPTPALFPTGRYPSVPTRQEVIALDTLATALAVPEPSPGWDATPLAAALATARDALELATHQLATGTTSSAASRGVAAVLDDLLDDLADVTVRASLLPH